MGTIVILAAILAKRIYRPSSFVQLARHLSNEARFLLSDERSTESYARESFISRGSRSTRDVNGSSEGEEKSKRSKLHGG